MKLVLGMLLAGGILFGAGPVSASPAGHTAKAAGEGMKTGWHKAAKAGQKTAAHFSWSRHRRRYHLRKAAGHSAAAQRSRHRAAANLHKARKGQ